MIDIHTHILPNVDDGAKSFDDALSMIDLEINDNVDEIILTPHYFINEFSSTNRDLLIKQYNLLKEKCSNLNIKLTFGAELYYSDLIFEEIKNHKVITLGETNFILIEFSLIQKYYDINSVIDEIVYRGYRPILAHAERYSYLTINDIKRIRNLGGFIQINTTSILGDFGSKIKRKSIKMLKDNLVDFVSSDAHDLKTRKPNLRIALEFIKKKYNLEFDNNIYER